MMWGWPIYKFQMTAVLTGRIRLGFMCSERGGKNERKGRVREKKGGGDTKKFGCN